MKFHCIYFLCKENGSLKTFLYIHMMIKTLKSPLSLQSVRITRATYNSYTFSPFGVNWISGLEFERDDIFILGGAIEIFFAF